VDRSSAAGSSSSSSGGSSGGGGSGSSGTTGVRSTLYSLTYNPLLNAITSKLIVP
jgi:hypothetical protein